jgi:LuxR family transcriptional regulator/LuxR family quorum-sensing system transcriptional regulator CciR
MVDPSDVLCAMHEARHPAELWDLMLGWYHGHGVDMISYHVAGADSEDITIVTDGFPQDWVDTYVSNGFVRIDPIPELAARQAEPFYWHDVRKLANLTPDAEHYLQVFERAKVGDGIAFAVFGPGLNHGYVGLGFARPWIELPIKTIFAFHCVAQAAHLRYCTLRGGKPATEALTPREREILGWVARGKSNSVIAQILTVSPHTVDAHMRSIYRKLEVSDRTSAALQGIGRALLPYPV